MAEYLIQISDAVTEELFRDAIFQITNSFCGVKFEDDSGSGSEEISNIDESSDSEYNSESEYNSDSDEDPDLGDNKHYCPIGNIIKISKTSSEFCTLLIKCTSGSRIKLGTFVLLPYLASGIFRNTFSWIGHVVKTAGWNGDIDTLEVRVPSHRFRCLENINIGDKVYYEHLKECFVPLVEIPENGIEIEKTAENGFHVGSARRTSLMVKYSDRKILERITKPCQGISFTERNDIKRHYCPLGQIVKLTKMPSESIILVEGFISPRNVYRHGYLQVFNIAGIGIFKNSFSSIGKINSYAEKIDGWEFEIKVKSDELMEKIKFGDTIYHVHYWECHVPVVKIARGGIQIKKTAHIAVTREGSEPGRSIKPKKARNPNRNAGSQIDFETGMGSSQQETSEPEFLNGILTKKEIKMAFETCSKMKFETGLNWLHSANRGTQVGCQPDSSETTKNPTEDIASQVDCQRGMSKNPANAEEPIKNSGTQISQEGLAKIPETTKNPNGNTGSTVDSQFETDRSQKGGSEPESLNGFLTRNEVKITSKTSSSIQRGIPYAFSIFKYSLSLVFIILLFYSFYCTFMSYYVYYILWSAI